MRSYQNPETCSHRNVKHFNNCVPKRIWCQDCNTRVEGLLNKAPAAAPAAAPTMTEPPTQSIDDALQELEAETAPEASEGVLAGIKARLSRKPQPSKK
jgi:hypothetical protein